MAVAVGLAVVCCSVYCMNLSVNTSATFYRQACSSEISVCHELKPGCMCGPDVRAAVSELFDLRCVS